jgi:hypothetical protein
MEQIRKNGCETLRLYDLGEFPYTMTVRWLNANVRSGRDVHT